VEEGNGNGRRCWCCGYEGGGKEGILHGLKERTQVATTRWNREMRRERRERYVGINNQYCMHPTFKHELQLWLPCRGQAEVGEAKAKAKSKSKRQAGKQVTWQMQSREHGVVLHSPTQPQSRKVERKTSETSGCNRYNLSTCDHFSATLGIVDKE
jgi:hypothetical protein